MAWGARSGLKRHALVLWVECVDWLNGLGSPFGIEIPKEHEFHERVQRLNGLGSPFGIETPIKGLLSLFIAEAKWPGEPVRDSYLASARPSCCSSYSHFIDQIK